MLDVRHDGRAQRDQVTYRSITALALSGVARDLEHRLRRKLRVDERIEERFGVAAGRHVVTATR
jgi:hypothetical protein